MNENSVYGCKLIRDLPVTQHLFESGGITAERCGEIGAERVDRGDGCISASGFFRWHRQRDPGGT